MPEITTIAEAIAAIEAVGFRVHKPGRLIRGYPATTHFVCYRDHEGSLDFWFCNEADLFKLARACLLKAFW